MDQLHDHLYRLHIEGLVSLGEFAQPLTQCGGRTVSEILLQHLRVRIGDRNIAQLHGGKLHAGPEIVILREHTHTDQLFLQNRHEVEQVLRAAATDVAQRIGRNLSPA